MSCACFGFRIPPEVSLVMDGVVEPVREEGWEFGERAKSGRDADADSLALSRRSMSDDRLSAVRSGVVGGGRWFVPYYLLPVSGRSSPQALLGQFQREERTRPQVQWLPFGAVPHVVDVPGHVPARHGAMRALFGAPTTSFRVLKRGAVFWPQDPQQSS